LVNLQQISASSNLTPHKSPLFLPATDYLHAFSPPKNEKSIQTTIMKNAPKIIEDTYIGSYSLETVAFFACMHFSPTQKLEIIVPSK